MLSDGEWPKGYGQRVKDLARQIKEVGIATYDLPKAQPDQGPSDPRRQELARARGYSGSLWKIFGHPIEVHTQIDPIDGVEHVTFELEES